MLNKFNQVAGWVVELKLSMSAGTLDPIGHFDIEFFEKNCGLIQVVDNQGKQWKRFI
jgi:hypothetical protein